MEPEALTAPTEDLIARLEANEPADIYAEEAAQALRALQQEVERLSEAVTPSGETKAAYHGEFKFQVTQWRENDDEEWEEFLADITVPWTTVKEIMVAIQARSALTGSAQG